MIPLIDTHQHLMYPTRFSYEWAGGIPVLNNTAYDVPAYQNLVPRDNVAGTIFMETAVDPQYYRAETEFALAFAADPSSRMLGVIAAAYPEDSADFDEWLEATSDNPLVVGYRRILHVVDDEMSRQPLFRENVRKIGAAGKTFDMCFLESQLDVAIELARACDNTQFILNHCGVPNVAGGDLTVWREKMTALAKLENVACKISGVVAYCGPDQDHTAAVRPYIEHVVEQFGADRCVWGGDWPVVKLAMDLPSWITITRDILSSETDQNQTKIFNQNTQRIYGVKL
ncbi:amidohydrolase family protein [Maritalea sp.]|uniref:amidohydrolase family protein n=1 Tax=Maritalea sp. TaxID=2003361 RepID=UPI003EF75152